MAPRTEVAVDLVTKLKDKGFKDLQKNTKSSEKALAALGKKLATVFGAAALTKFAKDSVKAFIADEKAAKSLTRTIGNLGLAFEDARVKKFIADLEKTSGVLDDSLRPAFQKLITTTGSVAKSQELLKLALDVSAGSGIDLVTVASDLSRAYVGSTKGLKKYSLGLTDAELKSKSFTDIQKILNDQFSGQNATRLDTYQGKVDQLNIAFENFKETIGRDLITALERVSGDQGVGGTTNAMDKLADSIGDAIVGTGELIASIKNLDVSKFRTIIDDINLLSFTNPYGLLTDVVTGLGKDVKTAPRPFSQGMSVTGATDFYDKLERERIAREKAAAAREKKIEQDRLRREKALAAEKKRTAEIERLRSAIQFRFDIDAINLQAALRRDISNTDRERVLQLSALKIADFQSDEEAIKTLQAATQGRYDDAMNREKVLQLLTAAGFANTKAAIDALAALKPDVKFTDNLDDVIARLKALIEGKYTINIGATITVPPIPAPGNSSTGIGPGSTFNPGGVRKGDESSGGPISIPGPIIKPPGVNLPGEIGGEPSSVFPKPFIPDTGNFRYRDETDTSYLKLINDLTNVPSNFDPGRFRMRDQGDVINVTVNVSGNVTTESDLVAAITDQLYQNQKTGIGLLYSSTEI